MKDILLVENPIVAAANRNIQTKFRNVFRSSHIDLLSHRHYRAAQRQSVQECTAA
jgi:hypothetical protein